MDDSQKQPVTQETQHRTYDARPRSGTGDGEGLFDVTGEALDQARRGVKLLESLLEALADGVVALDRRGRVIYWSRGMERLTGIAAAQAVGRSASLSIGPVGDRLMQDDTPALTDYLELPSGERVPARLERRPSHGPGGTVSGWVCAVTDVRRRWAARTECERASALAELGRSVASAVHQLRNPLGAASGFAELLEREIEHEESAQLLGKLRASLAEVDRRIGEVLTWSGPRRLDVRELDLTALVERIAEQVRARFPDGPRIELSAHPLGAVWGDEGQLRQAIENLVVNAAEAADAQGCVQVMTRCIDRSRGADADSVRIVVRNTGPQVAPERLQAIFEPFRSSKRGGTGLGLPLARRIVREHGGGISALSAGGWTSFVVTLPRDVLTRQESMDEETASGGIRHAACD